ncbi:MAG: chemotaxis response regulator protein-glutamate methylesterase [Rhodospirillales bacterium]|nr:chemotaxis response regulator protein-glutamate methylesterase [Rhodospirillales bacterium]
MRAGQPVAAARAPAAPAQQTVDVMIVDDSAVIRGLVARILESEPAVRVVASVANGQIAIDRLRTTMIDAVILDIEMPVMDGLTALPQLLAIDPHLKVIIASTLTTRNAEISLKCLDAGAVDYIPKPSTVRDVGGLAGGSDAFRRELLEKIIAHGTQRRRQPAGRSDMARAPSPPAATAPGRTTTAAPPRAISLRPPSAMRPLALAIGCSTGGPQALKALLGSLLSDQVTLPILITQHMPPKFTAILADHIRQQTGRDTAEAVDGEALVTGRIYVAPGDRHLRVLNHEAGRVLRLGDDPPQNFCRPAVDPMFHSLAHVFGPRLLAVVLTGMGSDGLKGAQAIVNAGGTVVAQDEASSVVWGMPGAVAMAGLCSAVEPITRLAAALRSLITRGQP